MTNFINDSSKYKYTNNNNNKRNKRLVLSPKGSNLYKKEWILSFSTSSSVSSN